MITNTLIRAELQKVADYLWDKRDIWNETRKLKPYDAFFRSCALEKQDEFYTWCEFSYEDFQEDAREEGIDLDAMKYIGRTSSFYLTDTAKYGVNLHTKGAILQNAIENLIDDDVIRDGCWLYDYIHFSVDNSGTVHINVEPDIYEDEEDYMFEHICGMLHRVKEYMHDAEWIAEYVDSFLEHDVEYFEDFLEGIIDYSDEPGPFDYAA